MELNRTIEDGITTLKISGNLLGEKDTNPILESINVSLENKSSQFLVDLTDLKYINSTGLSVLLTLLTKSRNAGGETVLFNIPEQLDKLLNMTKLTDAFTIADSLENAKNKLK